MTVLPRKYRTARGVGRGNEISSGARPARTAPRRGVIKSAPSLLTENSMVYIRTSHSAMNEALCNGSFVYGRVRVYDFALLIRMRTYRPAALATAFAPAPGTRSGVSHERACSRRRSRDKSETDVLLGEVNETFERKINGEKRAKRSGETKKEKKEKVCFSPRLIRSLEFETGARE